MEPIPELKACPTIAPRRSFLALAAFVLSCARGAAPDASAPEAAPRLQPTFDHHVHLLSPAGADSRMHAVTLPGEAARLLHQREVAWNDEAKLAAVYSDDAGLFWITRRWVSGPAAIARALAHGFTGPYRLKPATYRAVGDTAQIDGFMVEGDSSNTHFAFFHLSLKKRESGEYSIASETELFPGPPLSPTVTAEKVIQGLDAVGTRRAAVLSDAYYFATGGEQGPDELEKVRAENDWTAGEVAKYPGRLVAFCSVNPLRDYAMAELERCATSGRFKGLKLHLNAAQLNFHDPNEVAKVRKIMQSADGHKMPMVIHVRSSEEYGAADAEIFLHQLVVAAPDVPVQIAHLWGGESFSGPALAVYASAVAAGDPSTRNLYFDISGSWQFGKPEEMAEIVQRMRQIGMSRLLYGSDAPPEEAWKGFLHGLPLTDAEREAIAGNAAPYLR